MLVIKNIEKSFNGKKIIDKISLDLKRGDIAVMLGPSGVGKSTLLRILNNLETLDNGSISLDGAPLDLSKVNQTHIAGMVFQQFNLFNHLTVEQNITLALEKVMGKSKKEAQKIAQNLLKKYGLADKAHKFISQLSGGQKQRVAIARTVALQPTIVCLDEPTSALDPLLTTHVAKTIEQLAQDNYMVLIATHDIDLLKKLDCTIHLMNKGKIIKSAQSKEVFAHPEQFPTINTFITGTI